MLAEALQVTMILNEIARWPNIAEEFDKLGVKGRRADACSCPVARFVKSQLEVGFAISRSHFSVGDVHNYVTPSRVGDFIQDFDMGYYPKLVEK